MTSKARLLSIIFVGAIAAVALGQSNDIVVVATSIAVDQTNLQTAVNLGLASGRQVVLDATDRPFRIANPLVVKPVDTTGQAWIKIRCINRTSGWPTIEYSGTDVAVKFYGLKSSLIDSMRVRTYGTGASCFLVSTSGTAQSTNSNIFRHCWASAVSTSPAGWLIGPDGLGAADISCNTFEQCGANSMGNSPGMATGFWVFGGNTLDLAFRSCQVTAVTDYAFKFEPNKIYGPNSSGEGSVLTGCDVSQVGGFLKAVGGTKVSVIGGRTERCSGPAIWTLTGGTGGDIPVLGHAFAGATQISKVEGGTPVRIL